MEFKSFEEMGSKDENEVILLMIRGITRVVF